MPSKIPTSNKSEVIDLCGGESANEAANAAAEKRTPLATTPRFKFEARADFMDKTRFPANRVITDLEVYKYKAECLCPNSGSFNEAALHCVTKRSLNFGMLYHCCGKLPEVTFVVFVFRFSLYVTLYCDIVCAVILAWRVQVLLLGD